MSESKSTLNEEIDIAEKTLHMHAEHFGKACQMGDGFEAHITIGRLIAMIDELRTIAKRSHGSQSPVVDPRDTGERRYDE